MTIAPAHFTMYGRDQRASADFYRRVLVIEPTLDVPGMTEFTIMDGAILGLEP